MNLFERIQGATGVKVIVGSAFLWAWLDALFMSVFFIRPETRGFMPEVAVIAIFACGLPVLLGALASKNSFEKLLLSKRCLVGVALAGSLGSLVLILSGFQQSWPLLVVGGLLCGTYMSLYQIAWGGAYAHDGIRTAAPFVAGGFAGAVIIDTPLLFMIPEASAVFFALLPLASCIVLLMVDPEKRRYAPKKDELMPPSQGMQSRLKRYSGVPLMLLGAVALIMIGFGYMQHLVSFSFVGSAEETGGILIQLARGFSAILMFVVIVIAARRSSIVCRVGLLAMIAGFMMMPFMFGTPLFWVSGAIIIAGYTALDLFLWVTFSQIAYTQSRDPLKTMTLLRLLAVACYIIGAVVGIALVGSGKDLHEFVSAETTVVGYLVVIATVLLLGSEDVWILFSDPTRSARFSLEQDSMDQRLEACFEALSLTSREKDIASLLAYGRTQPWIAERLTISENTVGTHVRHIYQKAQVHNRQEFIDLVFSPEHHPSPESRDTSKSPH